MSSLLDEVERLGELEQLDEQLDGESRVRRSPTSTRRHCAATLGEDAVRDLRRLQEIERTLEESGALAPRDGDLELSPRGARLLGQQALTDLLARVPREPSRREGGRRPRADRPDARLGLRGHRAAARQPHGAQRRRCAASAEGGHAGRRAAPAPRRPRGGRARGPAPDRHGPAAGPVVLDGPAGPPGAGQAHGAGAARADHGPAPPGLAAPDRVQRLRPAHPARGPRARWASSASTAPTCSTRSCWRGACWTTTRAPTSRSSWSPTASRPPTSWTAAVVQLAAGARDAGGDAARGDAAGPVADQPGRVPAGGLPRPGALRRAPRRPDRRRGLPDVGRGRRTNGPGRVRLASTKVPATSQSRWIGPTGMRGASAGRDLPAELDQAQRAAAVAGERGEQFEHPGIVAAILAREIPGDTFGQVEVAGLDGVGIAEGDALDDRSGPVADAADRGQTSAGPRRASSWRPPRGGRCGGTPRSRSRHALRSTPARWNAQYGCPARTAGAGGSRRLPGPGAGSPHHRTIRSQARLASRPVTFCPSTVWTSTSPTCPDRIIRTPGRRRWKRATAGWCVGGEAGQVVVRAEQARVRGRAPMRRPVPTPSPSPHQTRRARAASPDPPACGWSAVPRSPSDGSSGRGVPSAAGPGWAAGPAAGGGGRSGWARGDGSGGSPSTVRSRAPQHPRARIPQSQRQGTGQPRAGQAPQHPGRPGDHAGDEGHAGHLVGQVEAVDAARPQAPTPSRGVRPISGRRWYGASAM